jgi:hypothetical protein
VNLILLTENLGNNEVEHQLVILFPCHIINDLRSGGLFGNDTLWRTILDNSLTWFYSDRQIEQVLEETRELRRYFAIVDGWSEVLKSPLSLIPVQSGLMLNSWSPMALDAVATKLMGFDSLRIPQITEAFSMKVMQLAEFVLEKIEIREALSVSSIRKMNQTKCFCLFRLSISYKGYLESPLCQDPS